MVRLGFKKMKKICFVVPRAYYLFNPFASFAEDKVGGAQKQAYLLSKGVALDQSFDVHFSVADFGQNSFETISNVKLWKTINFKDNLIKNFVRLISTMKKINADIYIFRSADFSVAITSLYIKLILKKRVLYMVAADAEVINKQRIKYYSWLTAFTMKAVYKYADKITVQTKQQSVDFEKSANRKPDAVIRNIYTNSFSEIDFNEKKTILWIGRLDRVKKPGVFLELAQRHENETFVMIAPVVRDHTKYGKSMLKKAKEISNINLLSFVNPNEINKFYLNAKLYILSSDLEGFSNTMAEALLAKCPVLSFKVNPDNLLNNYDCGYCADGNMERFNILFEELLNDSVLRKKMGENGAKYIIENHASESIIAEFKALL